MHVRYTSPVDGKEHAALVVPVGGDAAVQAHELEPGDRWPILASASEAGVVKSY